MEKRDCSSSCSFRSLNRKKVTTVLVGSEIMSAQSAAVPFWRAAGMTYITYSNICANLVRKCLKEPLRSETLARENVHFTVSKWSQGKPSSPTLRSDAA